MKELDDFYVWSGGYSGCTHVEVEFDSSEDCTEFVEWMTEVGRKAFREWRIEQASKELL